MSASARSSPRRQDSTVSTTSSGGRTIRASSIGRARRSSTSNGGIFARLRGRNVEDEDSSSDAGPSDWYRRSPSPSVTPPLQWRERAQLDQYDAEDGPSDLWRSSPPFRSASPVDDEKAFLSRMNVMEETIVTTEGENENHPAEVSAEQAGNQDDASERGSQMISPSASSLSLDRPFLLSKPGLPAFSRLRSHHRSVSSATQESFRPLHSRTPSQFSQLSAASEPPASTDPAFNFHPLRSLSASLFKQHQPVIIDVRGFIAVGTDEGSVLVYNFAQELKYTLPGTSKVTAIRISADQTYVAVGHASGNIHLWDLNSPSKPSRSTLALSEAQLKTGRKDGHFKGEAIEHVAFVAARHTAIVSGDSSGKAFWWSLGRVMGVDSNDVIRILGGAKRSKLFAAAPLPLGEDTHPTDETHISALLTPRKLVIIGLKPSPKTLHRRMGHGNQGCTAWLRAGELGQGSDPVLAYSWDQTLHFLRVPSYVEGKPYVAQDCITSLAWFDRNVSLVENQLTTNASIQAGTLMYWNDKILACVHKGDFLGAIHHALAYYNRTATGNQINLPAPDVIAARIRDLVSSSLNWSFSEERMRDDTHYSADGRGVDLTNRFENLAQSCIEACLAIGDPLDDAYEHFERAGIQNIFLRRVSAGSKRLSPTIVQALVGMYELRGEYRMAEEVIWSVDPDSLDINQAVTLCEEHQLWDALIYVYVKALHDYVTPIGKLLGPRVDPARIYRYLEAILTDDPPLEIFDAILGDYLPHLLQHPEAFLHVLDLVFEQSYLNDSSISRQTIINTLLGQAPGDTFVQIFIARNLPKYPQFIVLPPSTLHGLLVELCSSTDIDTLEDRELATESLLSAYTPQEKVIQLFEKAGFNQLLKQHYRRNNRWTAFARVTLQDPHSDLINDLADILPRDPGVATMLHNHLDRLLDADLTGAARLIDSWLPEAHPDALHHLTDLRQMAYLQTLLGDACSLGVDERHLYVALLRRHNPDAVLEHLDVATGLDIERLAAEFERDGFVEGQLWALDQLHRSPFTIVENAIRRLSLEHRPLDPTVRMAVRLAKTEGDWYTILLPLVEISQIKPGMETLVQETLAALIASKTPFPPLFKRLVDASDSGRGYPELRAMVTGMLDSYQAEGQLLLTTTRLVHADLFVLVQELAEGQRRGWQQSC